MNISGLVQKRMVRSLMGTWSTPTPAYHKAHPHVMHSCSADIGQNDLILPEMIFVKKIMRPQILALKIYEKKSVNRDKSEFATT